MLVPGGATGQSLDAAHRTERDKERARVVQQDPVHPDVHEPAHGSIATREAERDDRSEVGPQSIHQVQGGALGPAPLGDVPLENGPFGRVRLGLEVGEQQLPAHPITVTDDLARA
jgi:hypothetical protein